MKTENKTRREFLKTLGCGAAAAMIPTWLGSCARKKTLPNVLFIAVDDLNDWANCLGGRPGVHTPNLDRLAKRGVLFTNAHCSAPACNPSRASLFTGIRPSTSGIYYNRHHWRQSPVLKNATTIPEYFQSLNYHTAGGGKLFHCLSWIKTSYGTNENDPEIWDEYFPSKKDPLPEFVWPESAVKKNNGTVIWNPVVGDQTHNRPPYFFDWSPLDVPDRETSDYKVVDWATKKLNQNHEKPFFLGVGIFRPHIPWFVPKKYYDLYPLNEIKLPLTQENDLEDCSPVGKNFCRREWQEWILKQDKWKEAVQAYVASISYSDAQLGHLLDALDKSLYAENTIIVLWSDHGMHIGEKEHWEKFTLWEESTRIPLMFIVPGMTQPQSICQQPVSLLDVYPTLVELTGNRPASTLEGKSLVPLLRNPYLETEKPIVSTWGYNNHAIRSKHWRYIRYHDGTEELYDHRKDPNEFTNLASKPEYRAIMKKLATWIPEVNCSPLDNE